MAKVTLKDGKKVELKEKEIALVLGAKRQFADKTELDQFLLANSDLAEETSRQSRWHTIALVQARQAMQAGSTPAAA